MVVIGHKFCEFFPNGKDAKMFIIPLEVDS